MSISVLNSFENLVKLQQDGIYTISKIHWWLLKYKDLFDYWKENWNNDSCFGNLPCSHALNSEESKFQDFYQALDDISQLHKLNVKCREEILKFPQFKEEKELINEWLKKNEEIYNNLFVGFLLDNEVNAKHIQLYLPHYKKLEIKINTSEFKDVIEFLEIYNQLENHQ